MRYNGGKSYTIKRYGMGDFWRAEIARRCPGRFIDACCGSGAVATFIKREFPDIEVVANDVHPGLVELLRAVGAGWLPPRVLTELDYANARAAARRGEISPAIAFAGFACSYSGQWFSGYARPHARQRDHAGAGRKALLRDAPQLGAMDLRCGSYADLVDAIGVRADDVWYFDKPYEGTTGYKGTPPFDHAAFWTWAAELSTRARVLVSEFAAPAGWREVWSTRRTAELRSGAGNTQPTVRVDRVFDFDAAA